MTIRQVLEVRDLNVGIVILMYWTNIRASSMYYFVLRITYICGKMTDHRDEKKEQVWVSRKVLATQPKFVFSTPHVTHYSVQVRGSILCPYLLIFFFLSLMVLSYPKASFTES